MTTVTKSRRSLAVAPPAAIDAGNEKCIDSAAAASAYEGHHEHIDDEAIRYRRSVAAPILVDALRMASERPAAPETTDLVEAFARTWERRAARTFAALPAAHRQDAIQTALARLTSPITTAGLTPANLAPRVSASKAYDNTRRREMTEVRSSDAPREGDDNTDMLATMPSPDGDPGAAGAIAAGRSTAMIRLPTDRGPCRP